MTVDPAVFTSSKWRLAEFDEGVLAREALPAFELNPRRIDAAGGIGRAPWCLALLNRLPGAICVGAIDRARNVQVRRQRQVFVGVRHDVARSWIFRMAQLR